MITLVAIICLGILCQDVVVPTDQMVAGLVSDPVPMEYTQIMCRARGVADAQDWLLTQQQYEHWRVVKVMCVPGKYVRPSHA